MTYEYSAASARFEIDNPYKIENLALLACGAISLLAGLFLLIGFRDAMGNPSFRGVRAIVVGLLLLAAGIAAIGRATMQLRYFFGRGRPHDLTNLEASDGNVPQRRADWLKENLRQNALAYREPQGAISGLVHQVFKTLIFAPRLIRAAAEAQCFNALLTLAILLGLLATVAFYRNPAVQSWLAVIYLGALIPKLLRPFGRGETTYSRASAGIGFIAFIIAVPILGPPLLGRLVTGLPNIQGFDLPRTLGTCLFILLVAQSLFFLALMRQLRERPSVNMACVTRSLSMNSNPAKLFEELERTLQSRWTETIPNRRYALVKLPDVLSGQSGSFAGEVLEETQPVPTSGRPNTSVFEKLRDPASLPMSALTCLGALAYVGAIFSSIAFSLSQFGQPAWSTALLAITFFFTATYCLRSANLLWGRVDFQSVLVWVEINGSFEEARINIGNQLTTAMSSSKKIINVESMTLRVWAAELDTVILQKDGPRDLIGMRGRPDVAELYANHLERFAGQLASVVAPVSSADEDRLGVLARMQQHMGATPSLAALAAAGPPAAARTTNIEPRLPPERQRCRNERCRAELPVEAMFCSSCGTQLRAS